MWRKNRVPTFEAGCPGVDVNRNFDVNFGGIGTSDDPCQDSYHGPKALSERESSSIAQFIDRFNNIKIYISFHSYGQYLMFPYVSFSDFI